MFFGLKLSRARKPTTLKTKTLYTNLFRVIIWARNFEEKFENSFINFSVNNTSWSIVNL